MARVNQSITYCTQDIIMIQSYQHRILLPCNTRLGAVSVTYQRSAVSEGFLNLKE